MFQTHRKQIALLMMFAFISIALLVISGCTMEHKQTETRQSLPQGHRDELILAIGGEPAEGFDPTAGWGRYGSPLFQSTLLKYDSEMNIINDLATGYDISPDGLEWTVHLRDDVLFSDGEPLTAADVKFTFTTAAQSGSVLDLTNLKSIKTPDERTVIFTLQEPRSTFIQQLLTLGIVPKHAYGEEYALHPLGSGPFKLVQWDKGQQLIVEANPLYYGTEPFFKRLVFLFLEEEAAFAAAKTGQVDICLIPPTYSRQEVPGMRLLALDSVDNRGISFPVLPTGQTTENGLPIGHDVTADKAIRQAINVAIDRQQLITGLVEGYGTPAYSAADGLPWWNSQTIIEDGDLEAARQMLATAGWQDNDGDGILEKGSLKAEFNLLYFAGDESRQSLAIAVADMLKPLGLNIMAKGASWEEIEREMHSQPILFGWGSHDPLELYYLHSSNYAGVGWYNPGFYSNPQVDEYMTKALEATSEEEAFHYWQLAQWDGQIGTSALGDAPWAWLLNLQHLYLVREGLEIGQPKIQPHGHGWPITDTIAEWHWNEDN